MKNKQKGFVEIVVILYGLLLLVGAIGYVKCVIKFIHCDFNAPYKAEIIYGIGTFSPMGAIIGYTNLGK